MGKPWRLILSGSGGGAASNMAVDEAILRMCAEGQSPPTLRLYGWQSPSVSLGYFQRVERASIDLDYCRNSSVELVRRPTGGRAVLHGHDLTFSIALKEQQLPDDYRSIRASHVWLMGGILAGLKTAGIHAEMGMSDDGRPMPAASADCFAQIAQCDIRIGSEKIAGSAQVRSFGGVLEQGSIPCGSPGVDPSRVFRMNDTGIRHQSAIDLTCSMLERAIVAGFEEMFGMELSPGMLSSEEQALALDLAKNKYATDAWTYHRNTDCIDNDI